MNNGQTTGRTRLGLSLAMVTVVMWSLLPIALTIVLEQMDAYTLTMIRFIVAAVVAFLIVHRQSGWSAFANGGLCLWSLLMVAAFGLSANYVTYLWGLADTSPANAQVLILSANIFLAAGGVFFFRESFGLKQWMGGALMISGFYLFFGDQKQAHIPEKYTSGVLMMLLAALTWAGYALAQKKLLQRLSSQQVLLVVYLVGGFIFIPVSQPKVLLTMETLHVALLAFSAINTLIAYGAFSEALRHVEATKVAAVLPLTPVLTIGNMMLVNALWPQVIKAEVLGYAGIFGALIVVAGTVIAVQPAAKPTTCKQT